MSCDQYVIVYKEESFLNYQIIKVSYIYIPNTPLTY